MGPCVPRQVSQAVRDTTWNSLAEVLGPAQAPEEQASTGVHVIMLNTPYGLFPSTQPSNRNKTSDGCVYDAFAVDERLAAWPQFIRRDRLPRLIVHDDDHS